MAPNSAVIIFLILAGPWSYSVIKGDAGADLTALQDEFYNWYEGAFPEFSTLMGGYSYNDQLNNMSIGVFLTQYDAVQDFLNRTLTIDRSQLSQEQGYSYDVLLDSLTTFISNYEWRNYGSLNPISFLEGFYRDSQMIIDTTPFHTQGDFVNYIARLEARPVQIQQMIDRMRESIRIGTTYHLVSVIQVPSQIAAVTSVDPEESILFQPFNSNLDSLHITESIKVDLRARGLTALRGVWGALNELSTFFTTEYLNNTRSSYGVGGLPSGGNYYRACLAWHLSLDLAPGAVHEMGLREVDRIMQLMETVMRRQGFNGTVEEYFSELKQDPRFHKNSAEELLKDCENLINNRIYPTLPQLFKDIPPSRPRVAAMPYDGPAGMYLTGNEDGSVPGTLYVNVMRPNETNTFTMPSFTLHETVPGHHLQSVYDLAARLPDFQKKVDYDRYYAIPYHFPMYTAHIEGWALYAEYLGEELGLYIDDYELMGRYSGEIFRACRLVVDTGMHFMGWTRDRAIRYMEERIADSRAMIEIEIDRYLTWPGQACAYKVGELKIKELRERAERALGDHFDVRDFHSVVLNHGPVPLHILETIIDDYIKARREVSGTGGPIIG